jgi:hypothetical protein
MLSLTSPFTENDIISIRVYKTGKVYLLQGNGDDIVVKQEDIKSDGVGNFDLSKKAMGVIDKSVKSSKKLADSEVTALVNYVIKQKAMVQWNLRDRIPGAAADLDLALANLKDPAGKNLWFKMPHTPMMNLQSALESRHGATLRTLDEDSKSIAQSDKPMRDFLRTLKDPGGLEALGRIIAIDCFSGNQDRVAPGSYRKETLAGHSFVFHAIQNIGNLMVTGQGKAKTLSGMDFADPNSALKEADKSLDEHRQKGQGEWLGDYIVDAGKRKKFAGEVITDLEMIFTTGQKKTLKRRIMGSKPALGSDSVNRLDAGMVSGAKLLSQYIKDKVNKGKVLPPSYVERATLYYSVT